MGTTHPRVVGEIKPPSRIHLHSNRARGVSRGAQARPRAREESLRRRASLFHLGRAHALRGGALVAEDARLQRVVGPRVRRHAGGGLHQREGGDERGVARGEDEGGGGAHAEADEEDGADVEVELEDESDGVGGERGRGVGGVRGPLTVAVAAGVGGDDAEAARGEGEGEGGEDRAGLAEVVEEEGPQGGAVGSPSVHADAEAGGQVEEEDGVGRKNRGDGRRRARPLRLAERWDAPGGGGEDRDDRKARLARGVAVRGVRVHAGERARQPRGSWGRKRNRRRRAVVVVGVRRNKRKRVEERGELLRVHRGTSETSGRDAGRAGTYEETRARRRIDTVVC